MKVADLSGQMLDYWVARADGFKNIYRLPGSGSLRVVEYPRDVENYAPSTNWAQSGPIIECEQISIDHDDRNPLHWHAQMQHAPRADMVTRSFSSGHTPLIAAMRCFVASKFGEEVNCELDQKLADRLVRDFSKP